MAALGALRADAAGAGSALTLFTVGDNAIVHAPGERYGMIHEITGMAPVAPPPDPAMTGERPPAGSPEALALRERREARLAAAMAAEPDWLFVLDRGSATGGDLVAMRVLSEHPHVAASAAWRAKRVYHLDPPGWYVGTGGYLELMRTVEDMRSVLQGR